MGTNTLGRMDLRFYTRNEVHVADAVPEPSQEAHYPLWFAFMFAGRLLNNYPRNGGAPVAKEGLQRLAGVVDTDSPFARNESMLGVLSSSPLRIVGLRGGKAKDYSGELMEKNGSLFVITKIAFGDEDFYHRAAIDAVFETVRRRMGDDGGALLAAALGFLSIVAERGADNQRATLGWAAGAAAIATAQIAERASLEEADTGNDRDDPDEPWDGNVYLGASYVLSVEERLIVTDVDPGSPAHAGGLLPGDTIEAVGTDEVRSIEAFDGLLSGKKPGDTVALAVRRGKKTLALLVTLGESQVSPGA